MNKKWLGGDFFALIIYFILALAVTFPLVSHFRENIIGLPGDPFFNLWGIWWDKYTAFNNLDPTKIFLLNAPTGIINNTTSIFSPLGALTKTIALFSNEVVAFNATILFNLVLSAWAGYFLIKFLIKKYWIAIIIGALWGFSPYALAHTQHLTLSALWLLPFFLLALFKMIEEKNALYFILASLIFVLISVTDFYYLFFAIIIFVLYFLYCLIFNAFYWKKEIFFTNLRIFFFFLIVTIPLITIVNFKLFQPFIVHDQKSLVVQASERKMEELETYTARGRDYFLPPPNNFFLGGLTANYVRESLDGSNLSEQTLYLGVVPCAVALIIFILTFTGLIKTRPRFYILFFTLLALVAFVFSFSPSIKLWGNEIKMPSYYFYNWGLNMFRVYARFGVLVLLGVLVLFAYGLDEINLQARWRFPLILFLFLTFIEFFNFPLPNTNVSYLPAVYRWLKAERGDFIIAEYPLERSDYVRQSQYQMYQRLHRKRMFNGAPLGSKEEETRQRLMYLDYPAAWEELKKIGVKYVLIHKDYYSEGKIPLSLQDSYSPEIEKIIPYPAQDRFLYQHQAPKIDFGDNKVKKVGEWENILVYQID